MSKPVLDCELVALKHYQHTYVRAQHQDILALLPKISFSITLMPGELKYSKYRNWT